MLFDPIAPEKDIFESKNYLQTPSFLSSNLKFSSNLLDSHETPRSQKQWGPIDFGKPLDTKLLDAELEDDLNQLLQQLNLGVDYQNYLTGYTYQDIPRQQFHDPFRKTSVPLQPMPGQNSQLSSQRLSIWSTGRSEEGSVFSRPQSERSLQFSIPTISSGGSPIQYPTELNDFFPNSKKNIYAEKTNQPSFVPAPPRAEPRTEMLLKALRKECHQRLFDTCTVKNHAEDFCSTFYKRNQHGYMFTRESSNSPKVNSSGAKSWVTINVKLDDEQRKLKVDVKRLPVWRPINLNQPMVRRKKKQSTGGK